MSEIEKYEQEVTAFQRVSLQEAEELLQQEQAVLYIGRETCPYCRKFVAKLSPLAIQHNWKIAYLHSQDPNEAPDAVMAFRNDYNVKTVPGLIVVKQNDTQVRCDSSMSNDAIVELIEGV